MRKQLFILSTLLLAMILLGSCKSASGDSGKPQITVTIEPIRFFAEAIGGDCFNFVSQIPKGANPETYDITPQQLVTLAQSKAYLRIGYIGFETVWMERLMENNPQMKVYDLSKGVDLITTESGGIEPHIWNSTINARVIARNILDALKELDPDQEKLFQANYENLLNKIQEVEQQVKNLTAQAQCRSFLIYHPTLTYFARDCNLTQICIEEDGKEPSIQQLKQITDESIAQGVKTIFIQPEFDHENAKLIAQETGSQLSEIYPLTYDWDEEMVHIAEILSKN